MSRHTQKLMSPCAGAIPASIGNLTNLQTISLGSNKLEGACCVDPVQHTSSPSDRDAPCSFPRPPSQSQSKSSKSCCPTVAASTSEKQDDPAQVKKEGGWTETSENSSAPDPESPSRESEHKKTRSRQESEHKKTRNMNNPLCPTPSPSPPSPTQPRRRRRRPAARSARRAPHT